MSEREAPGGTIVLGGGIFGAALAYHLARAEEGAVALVDRGPVGGGSTAASAGILVHAGWDPWDLALVHESAREYRELSARTGAGAYLENGGIRVARSAEGARWLERIGEVARTGAPGIRRLDPSELADRCPALDLSDATAALFVPEDAVFAPEALARAYAQEARRAGATVLEDVGGVDLRPDGDRWSVEAASLRWTASRVVLACGPWTGAILRGLGHPLPLAPFRSRTVHIRPRPLAAPAPTLHDDDLKLYVRPAPRGRLLLGDGTERRTSAPDVPSDAASETAFAERMRTALRPLAPGWRSLAAERSGSGTCVSTPDRFPLVGRVPGAPGLYLASGFNGFGAMRAGALAHRLATALRSDEWAPLAPADPARFREGTTDFDPLPELPLESEELLRGAEAAPATDLPRPALSPRDDSPEEPLEFRRLKDPTEARALELPSLSEWFDPFLPFFLAEALRAGGSAEVALRAGEPLAAYLFSPAEGTGSVFTRVPALAEHYLGKEPRTGTYLELPLRSGATPIELFAADLRDWELPSVVRTPVRIAGPADLDRVRDFLHATEGPVDAAWFEGLPAEETCFLAEANGQIAGVSWATIVGRHARGHTFAVHPRYRGLGVGTDLLHGRMTWLKARGVLDVVSEIYAGNDASRTAAERAGMTRVGTMYHARGGAPASPTSEGRRTADRPSPSNR
jgi:sarcosine oxidase subunit beta